jgi:hypothetical protein
VAEYRRSPRTLLRTRGVIANFDGSIVKRCLTIDVSATGAKLVLPEVCEVPDKFVLILTQDGTVRRECEVMWRRERSLGVRFVSAPQSAPSNASTPLFVRGKL